MHTLREFVSWFRRRYGDAVLIVVSLLLAKIFLQFFLRIGAFAKVDIRHTDVPKKIEWPIRNSLLKYLPTLANPSRAISFIPIKQPLSPKVFGFSFPSSIFNWRSRSDAYLLEFYGHECEHCAGMYPIIKRIEKELDTNFHFLEVWHNPINFQALRVLDVNSRCGGLPFFFNLKTFKHICGATTYENLKAWASGLPSKENLPPPLKMDELEALNRKVAPTRYFAVEIIQGVLGRIFNQLKQARQIGEKKMLQRLEQDKLPKS
ncbi:hypothetical protein IE077_001502 [Cardiosporidium cionae]|uniref:Thioredoxin domain-containing protein n=1 Tax=Cardiosporidium cionae TaxID=476202 RepID=A0ABQ7J598_9APIC|nr:hypothetical protein IE077_001502 [Cardiosporidium cionae]|eukprot:KAF8819181.1 hypothetical protein IE077_001502 [Cardiosporidium cionae]